MADETNETEQSAPATTLMDHRLSSGKRLGDARIDDLMQEVQLLQQEEQLLRQKAQDAIRQYLTPYVREKALEAMRQCAGDTKAAEKLMTKWAKKDDKLYRQLREPYEGKQKPPLLSLALNEARETLQGEGE